MIGMTSCTRVLVWRRSTSTVDWRCDLCWLWDICNFCWIGLCVRLLKSIIVIVVVMFCRDECCLLIWITLCLLRRYALVYLIFGGSIMEFVMLLCVNWLMGLLLLLLFLLFFLYILSLLFIKLYVRRYLNSVNSCLNNCNKIVFCGEMCCFFL